MGMTGLFSLLNHSDLEPSDIERNTTMQELLNPKMPKFDMAGSKLQFHLHQMSLSSILFSYLRKNKFNAWIIADSPQGY